jgi:hypothetical protein
MSFFVRTSLAVVLLGAAALLASPLAHAQQCGARAVTSSTTEVYEKPPRFAFGVGWEGAQIERLSAGVPIFVCREIDLQFGLTTRTWVQIGYRATGDWRYGWIAKDSVRIAVRTDGVIKRLYTFIFERVQAYPTYRPA